MSLAENFSPRERTRLVHAAYVVAGCLAYSVAAFAILDGDLRLEKFDFLPDAIRLILGMCLGFGSVIALAVAAWVTLYNAAFFIGRIRGRDNSRTKL